VPGLLAVAQLSNGSVANVDAISAGVLEAGLAQADVVYWAYTGTETFAGKSAQTALRVVANLYAESIHVVVARESADVQSIDELADRRVSLDEQGSGTLVDARIILSEYGLDERALQPVYIKPQFAAERLSRGMLDAFFIVAGYPTPSVVNLAARAGARLLPIEAQRAASITQRYPFFSPDVIPGGVYTGIGETPTVSVGAQLVVSARLDPDFVYGITRALWSKRTREMLAKGHAKGAEIRLETALRGVSVPLHEGAERFYREAGMLPAADDGARRTAVQPLAGLRP